jgi:hypothetical protein
VGEELLGIGEAKVVGIELDFSAHVSESFAQD